MNEYGEFYKSIFFSPLYFPSNQGMVFQLGKSMLFDCTTEMSVPLKYHCDQ